MQIDETEHRRVVFLVQVGMRGNLLAHLSRIVIEGSRGVDKRVKRQDEGSISDFLIIVCEVFSTVCKTGNGSTI